MSAARIRSVKLKTGADVHVLKRPAMSEGAAALMRHAQMIVADPHGDIAGYAIVRWTSDGGRNECFWIDKKRSPFGETMMPAIVHDILFRRVCDPREG